MSEYYCCTCMLCSYKELKKLVKEELIILCVGTCMCMYIMFSKSKYSTYPHVHVVMYNVYDCINENWWIGRLEFCELKIWGGLHKIFAS